MLEFNEARIEIIKILKNLELNAEWKIILDLNPISEKIRLRFLKKDGWKIKQYYLFQHWVDVRIIKEFSYIDLLEKIEKHPFLLETETVI